MIIFTEIKSAYHEKINPAQLMEVMVLFYSLLMTKGQFDVRHFLSVYKRLKANVSSRLINEYRRLVEDKNTENQGYMKFSKVAPIGELRK